MAVRTRLGHRGFGKDQRGVAAIEFALVLPFMLLLYLGSIEVCEGVAIDRMVAVTSTTVANLVSQYSSISLSQQMPDILDASAQVLEPYPSANATVVVSCINVDGSGHASIAWSQALNGASRTVGQSIALPSALDVPNTSLILGETTYAYKPLFDFLHIGPINLHSSVYMYPRQSTTVDLTS